MPITNDDYCLGTHSRDQRFPRCPFPQGSVRAWSWWKGQRSSSPIKPDGYEGVMRLLAEGPQGHNMAELMRDIRIVADQGEL